MISNFFLNIYDKLKRKMQTDYKISNELLTKIHHHHLIVNLNGPYSLE